ncbi:YcnI family copper-binding membrane protein [Ruegeria arenilitoris]|uniref:YcnI family copper-binding membrane protein n=1 Tax=Ruegeria arenilitoris TaxID=1173585 RepID=UPI00147C94AF|nr:DUF1775 domain-containing protein [Ruegeria arenilitoris]
MKLLNIVSAAVIAAVTGTCALAHATLETQEAEVGSFYKGVMRVGHGCDGQATLKMRIVIPEGVISVKPMPKAGWVLETVTGDYAHSYDYYGKTLTSGVKEIIWTGELSNDHYDEFVFRAKLDGSLTPDQMLFFPTVQECASADQQWIEIPAEGQDPHELEHPAPGLHLKAGHSHNH